MVVFLASIPFCQLVQSFLFLELSNRGFQKLFEVCCLSRTTAMLRNTAQSALYSSSLIVAFKVLSAQIRHISRTLGTSPTVLVPSLAGCRPSLHTARIGRGHRWWGLSRAESWKICANPAKFVADCSFSTLSCDC